MPNGFIVSIFSLSISSLSDSNQTAINTLRVDEASFIENDCSTQPLVNISFVDDCDSYVVEIHTEIASESAGDEYESDSEDETFIYLQTTKSFLSTRLV